MSEPIRREEAAQVSKKLDDCKRLISRGTVFPCLMAFREAMEKTLAIKMLPADEKKLHEKINILQKELADSSAFRKIYGPVTFRDDDLNTSLDFLKQLIRIKEEELQAEMAERQDSESERQNDETAEETSRKSEEALSLIERGEIEKAKELIAGNEDIIAFLVAHYNAAGIEHRKAGRYEEALSAFRNALLVDPGDEGLFYNIARVHIERKEWDKAREAILKALALNPDFQHGLALLKHIEQNR